MVAKYHFVKLREHYTKWFIFLNKSTTFSGRKFNTSDELTKSIAYIVRQQNYLLVSNQELAATIFLTAKWTACCRALQSDTRKFLNIKAIKAVNTKRLTLLKCDEKCVGII